MLPDDTVVTNGIDSSAFPCAVFSALVSTPTSSRFCKCRAGCAEAGVLGRRRFALESAATRVCGEVGAKSHDKRDGLGLGPVANVCRCSHGAQVAVDTTLVSLLKRDAMVLLCLGPPAKRVSMP